MSDSIYEPKLYVLQKYERMQQLFDLLNEKKQKCKMDIAAYIHLTNCLWEVESYLPLEDMMGLEEFRKFKFCPKTQIHYWESRSHMILIHVDGAYGIYRNKKPTSIIEATVSQSLDTVFYKAATPLVLFPNHLEKTLW